jgi:hypothetical protein
MASETPNYSPAADETVCPTFESTSVVIFADATVGSVAQAVSPATSD